MTMTSVEQLRSLADVDREDAALVGNKATTLATLRRAGFPVPDGVVLTTEALEHALTAAGTGGWGAAGGSRGDAAARRPGRGARRRSPAAGK